MNITEYVKRLGIEPKSSTASPLDIEAGKAGYNQYLADIESFKKVQEETQASVESNKSWWDKASDFILRANGMSSQMSDNPIASGFNAAVEAYKNIPEDNKPSDDWTDEERWAFGEKYATNAEDAYAFAKDLNSHKAKEKKQKQEEAIANWSARNLGTGALASAASLGINTVFGGVGYLDALAQKAAGKEIEQNILLPHEVAGAMQSGVAGKLNEWSGTINDDVWLLGGKGVGDVYSLGMSIAQSILSGKLAKISGSQAGTLISYFGMSASQGITDALERGANNDQAIAFGTISGLAEAIPEMISVDKLVGMSSAEGVQNLFKNMLGQAISESAEEVFTSLITNVADDWIMEGKSQFYQTVNQLVASGMSLEEAKNKAWSKTFESMALDALGGFISGGVSAGIVSTGNRINQQFLETEKNEAAKKILAPEQSKLIEDAKQYDTTKKRASALEKKVADGKELSGYELRMLSSQLNEAKRTKDVDTVRKAIVEQMKTEGVSEAQAKTLGEIALNKAIGNDVSKVQELMLKRNAAAMKVYNQISAEVMESGMGESEWAEKTPIQRLRAEKKASEMISDVRTQPVSGAKLEQVKGQYTEVDGKITFKKSENSRIHIDGITSSLTADDIAELSAIEKIANELGIDIHVYETTVDEKGQRTYTDKTGKKLSDSGFYDPNNNSIHIDLRAGQNGEGTMLYTASHEVVHFIKENADEHYAALEELVTKELVKGGMSIEKLINAQKDILKRNGWTGNEDNFEDVAREEMVAEACQSFLASKSAVAEIKALKTKNKGLWTALKKFFTSIFTKLNKVYKTVDPDSIEGKYIADMRGAVKNIRDAFMEGAVAAGEKYNAEHKALGEGATVKLNSKGEFVQGEAKDGKTILSNARTYQKGGRATLKATLEAEGYSEADVEAALKIMDGHMELVKEFGEKYTAQDVANNAVLTTDVKTGEAVLSAIISNGDYPVNIDLLTICKKREAYQQVINRLCESGMINKATIDSLAIAEINKILGKYGFETACLGCYVESRRIRIQEWAQTIVKEWNGIVDKLEGKGKGKALNASSEAFVADLSNEEVSKLSAELEEAYERDGLKYGRATVVKKMEQLQREVPSLRRYLSVADLITPTGRANLKSWSSEVNSLVNCRYGSNTPKIIQKFNPYNSELAKYGIVPKGYKDLRDYLYAIGGARMQSFSDFIVENWFDYAQIVADLSARKLPMHTYTKEAILVKLFGMTGIKINMSLIPDVDSSLGKEYAGLTKNSKGEYELIFADKDRYKATGGKSYMQSFNFADAIALQNDPNYSANVGTIAIGISNKQIEMMLDDSRIRMVIPYHSSGMNPIFAHLVGIKNYNDYTNYQNTTVKRLIDADGNVKNVKLKKEQIANLTKDFQFNEALQRLGDARKAADEYKAWCRDSSKHTITIDGKTYYAELTPKFEQFSAHENYYKLLADYNPYDCITEESKPQGDVTQTYPDNFSEMLGDELRARDIYAKKQDAKWDDAMAEINSYLETHTRADTVKYADEHGIKISEKDRKLAKKEVRHQARSVIELSKDNELSNAVAGTRGAQKYKIIAQYIRNVLGDEEITLSDGRVAIVDKSDTMHIANKSADKKTAQISKIKEIIQLAELTHIYENAIHPKFNEFYYYTVNVRYENESFPIYLNVGKAINDGKNHIYDITNRIRDTAGRINGLERPKPNEGIRSANGISYNSRIPQSTEKVNTPDENSSEKSEIRHKSRSYTAGQAAAMNANLRHQKVYTKSTAMKFVKAIAPNISAKSFDKLSNELWIGLNTYTSLKDKRDFAKDMADMIVDRMLVDTEVKNRNWDEAVDKIAYLKPAINTIKFREEDLPDLEHMLDKNGLRSLRARWGYKSREGENKRAYGLDEFITDLSREMPGMAYLADMHPTEAMVEVDKLYKKLKETIRQRYESAYEDATEEQVERWKSTIEAKIIDVYEYYGGMSRMLQATSSTSEAVDTYLSTVPEGTEKPEKYFVDILKQMDERISYWKAEKSKTERISRWNGIIANKALEIRDFKNGAFLNATQYHPDVFKNSIEELTKVQWRGNISPKGVRKTFAELKKWYTMDNPMLYDKNNKENNDDLYSDAIAFYIDELAADIEKPLSADEYPMIYEVMNHLYTMMKNYGKIFRAGRWVDAADIAKAYIGIIDANDKKRTAWTRAQSLYNRQFLEPMALARQADNYNPNGFFTQTVQELRQASVDASVGEMKLRKEYDEFVNANQKYLMNAAKETVKYRGKDIPKLHLISLYMTMKRKQSREGLALNGFEYTMKTAWWDSEDVIKVPGYLPQSEKHNIDLINRATEEQMKIIAENFTDTDRQYMAILEKLFNEKLREMKIERDMERQGYTNALEGYYYPIIRGGIAKNVDTAKFTDVNRATNSSFNKSTQEHAQQYLKIISADAMVNRHIKDMCKYYYMSQAIENYNVLYQIDTTEGDPNLNNPRNIAERLKVSKIWEKDFDYFKKLVADIQGIRDNKYDSDGWRFIETIRGNYAKFALGLNAKVLFTQISSVIAAGDVIGFGSIMSVNKDVGFVGTKEDIAKYCPIADVRSYEQTALKAMTLSDKLGKVSEKLMIGISVMDDLVVRRLFAACQVEAKKRGEGEIGSEENKIAAGKILEQIIIETQQNSYATEKSSAMRSANPLWRGLTMFTADGMKVISRIHEAVGEFKLAKNNGDTAAIKKARKKLARSIAVAATISVYLAAISTLFNWIYDRDEEDKDDKPIEKVFKFSLDVVGNFIGALPGISDLYDTIVNGFEVEDVAYDTINNLFGSLANLYKDATDMRDGKYDRGIEDLNRDLRSLLYAVGQVTGMPVRNVYNLARGLVGKASPKAAYYIDSKFNETSLINDLKKSLQQGNDSKTSYIMSLIYDERLDERVSAGQSKEISRLYEKVSKKEIEGYSILPRDIPDEIKKNGKTYELSDEQKEKIISEYSKVITAIDKLIASSFYLARSDKDRAYLIDYYHDKYYETAVNNALKIKDDKVAVYNAVGFSTYAKFAYATRGIESDKDKNGNTIAGSKKANVIEAIDKISNNEDKKLLYLASLGYSLSDEQKKKLCKYLNSLSISSSKRKSLAEICNFTYKNGKIYP